MHPESTCWTLIRGAADGNSSDREQFARLYEPVVRAYLAARWRDSRGELADAVQEVFLACFQPEGVLERADPQQPGGFRAFLYGVARNVARWRRQALEWLRGDLAALREAAEKGPPQARLAVQRTLAHWQQDPDLAGLRDEKELAKLPAAERKDWQKFWGEVAGLLAKANGDPE